MLQLQVRYCKTGDGVDVAYATYGDGPPIIVPPNIMNTHLQLELNYSNVRGFYERLSKRLRIVRYDARGTGMSQRDVVDLSPEAFELDVLAVADRLGLERFALYSHIVAGRGPAAFAAKHPERVTSLVWWVGQTMNVSPEGMRQMNAIVPLMEDEWELYTNVVGRLLCGWDSPDASMFAELIRAGSSPEARRAAFREALPMQSRRFSVTDTVRVPTLVAHLAAAPAATALARSIAAGIPTAHVVAIPGLVTSKDPFVADNEVLVAAIADFVESTSDEAATPVQAPELRLGAMRAILFTDIVGHTEMMQRLGDAKGRDVLREHERITREVLAAHGGAEVKAMGDGFMAWFPSAAAAVGCAVELQRGFASQNLERGAENVHVRVGLNAGEPIEEDGDLFGTAVIAASRICSQAGGGEIVVSDVVRQLVAGKGFSFGDRGVVGLKGFEEPVQLWGVVWGKAV